MILRVVVVTLAVLLGLAGGAAVVSEFRDPIRTVVEPIVLSPGDGGDGGVEGTARKRPARNDAGPRPAPERVAPEDGAAPVPAPPPAPAGDDDDDDHDDADDDDDDNGDD